MVSRRAGAIALSSFLLLNASDDFTSQADALMEPYVKKQTFSGSVLVAKLGKPVYRKGFGFANREWEIPNTPDTKFRLGSITKQFTATAILQLAEEGKLSVNDPVSKYYKEAPASWAKITLHHLLTHTSGIPSYTDLPGFFDKASKNDLTPVGIIRLTQDKPLEFEPGTSWKYDNTGYIILGYVIEQVSGEKYADYLNHHIFAPLGMKATGYDVFEEVIPHRASGYEFGKTWTNAPYLAMSLPYAAGSLYSTVDDLLIWDQALLKDQPLKAESEAKMFTPYSHNYGYGWFIDEEAGHHRVSHEGGINGFNTLISRFPSDGVTIIVLSNVNTGSVGKIGTQLAGLMFGNKALPGKP
jgi:CubicO group peptidase (beta-lactamase class C family)